MSKTRVGFIPLLIKIGPKLAKLVKPLISGGKAAKVGLFGTSAVAYSALFGWKVALMLIGMLFLHEGGHIVAMKMRGMKVKGMYFIPFVGAMAVADDAFPSREAEGFTALMGPTVGWLLCIGSLIAYMATQSLEFVAAAGWMAFVNLINLLPILPLDGGRAIRSLTFSINTRLGFVLTIAGFLVGALVMIKMQIWLFLILLPFGVMEIMYEKNSHKELENIKLYAERAREQVLGEIEKSKGKIEKENEKEDKEFWEGRITVLQEQVKVLERNIALATPIPNMNKVQIIIIALWTIILAGGLLYTMNISSVITGGNFIELLQ